MSGQRQQAQQVTELCQRCGHYIDDHTGGEPPCLHCEHIAGPHGIQAVPLRRRQSVCLEIKERVT
tara:strand:- start:204 stop:398 length:195 start_codon:yes stop_codon:yes gene_type:complete